MLGVLKCHNTVCWILHIEGCFSCIPSAASYWIAAYLSHLVLNDSSGIALVQVKVSNNMVFSWPLAIVTGSRLVLLTLCVQNRMNPRMMDVLQKWALSPIQRYVWIWDLELLWPFYFWGKKTWGHIWHTKKWQSQ